MTNVSFFCCSIIELLCHSRRFSRISGKCFFQGKFLQKNGAKCCFEMFSNSFDKQAIKITSSQKVEFLRHYELLYLSIIVRKSVKTFILCKQAFDILSYTNVIQVSLFPKMNWVICIFLFTVVHTTRDYPLRRRYRSLKVGSVVIENQTTELIKVYIEPRNRN